LSTFALSVDDNGTFSCIAENKAGIAKAEFTLHVVVPVPPKPPQVNKNFYFNLIFFRPLKYTDSLKRKFVFEPNDIECRDHGSLGGGV